MYPLQRAYLLFSIWEVTENPRRICTPVIYFCGAYCHRKMKLKVTQPSIHVEVPEKAWISFLLMKRNQSPKILKHRWPLSRRQMHSRMNLKTRTHQGVWSEEFLVCFPPFKKFTNELGIINQPLCLFFCFSLCFLHHPLHCVSIVGHFWRGSRDGQTPVKSSLLHILHMCSYPVFSTAFSKFHSTTESWSPG